MLDRSAKLDRSSLSCDWNDLMDLALLDSGYWEKADVMLELDRLRESVAEGAAGERMGGRCIGGSSCMDDRGESEIRRRKKSGSERVEKRCELAGRLSRKDGGRRCSRMGVVDEGVGDGKGRTRLP